MLVGGAVVASKQKVGLIAKLFGNGGFPDEDEAVKAVAAAVAGAKASRAGAPG